MYVLGSMYAHVYTTCLLHIDPLQQTISTEPIRLTIFSPHVLNLTLVDLPGLTRVRSLSVCGCSFLFCFF
jgi:hypothetical protein